MAIPQPSLHLFIALAIFLVGLLGALGQIDLGTIPMDVVVMVIALALVV